MKTPYIKQLYKDANIKAETIQKYIKIFSDKLITSINDNYEYIKMYEELFTLYQKLNPTGNNDVSVENLAIEKNASTQVSPDKENLALYYNAKLPEITSKLNTTAPLIAYNFENLNKLLQYLQVALQNYQALVLQIEESWKSMLNL